MGHLFNFEQSRIEHKKICRICYLT